ncbi:cyclase family protein [Halalkalibacter alkaliphilus]|uniref:Cyclase family protein n=1 Tax=Halalkalibacter alkaliphilus TaxID=2917993 RepID=A0A9X2CV71_9BACI|nr:cyclase family protein [Halalkalibacter alkaliphilus]MCL7748484.1 cyclase family protein [Halalkalibacter alkaliphilus]
MVDISVPIDKELKDPLPFSIRYESHDDGAELAAKLYGLQPEDFPERKWGAGESLSLTSHAGTHVDAPWHYWPTSEGKPSRTIDELPLEWFYSDGVVLDFTDKAPGYELTIQDLEQKLAQMEYKLKPYDIVMIRCDADKKMYQDDYAQIHVGVSADATRWLIEQGIKVMGTDGWGWDTPFYVQAEDYKSNPRPDVLWAAHFVGKEKEYCQIEKLANLDQLPPYGFKVSVFPVKIKGGSAGWTRAVAIIEE